MTEKPQIPASWSEGERWAWKRIKAGEIADFNERDREKDSEFKDLDPRKADGWNDSRRLSASFLQTILVEMPFVEATPFKGVRILGALIEGDAPLDLAHARIDHLFWLIKSRLLVGLACRSLHITDVFSLDGSYFSGTVSLHDARIDDDLSIENVLCQGDVDLNGARIRGQLSMIGSTFDGKLHMNSIEIGRDLFMRGNAIFREIHLRGAKIGRQVSMSGSTFNGKLNMNAAEVGQNLHMSENALFEEVELVDIKVQKQLSMSGSTFNGKLDMNTIEVGQYLLMNENAAFKEVDLGSARIGGQLTMSGSRFEGRLGMNRSAVSQDLYMDEQATFKDVDLLGARVGAVLTMSGSTFNGELNMNTIEVGQHLFMNEEATFKEVDLGSAKIGGQLTMRGSRFEGRLGMNRSAVGQHLFMNEKATFQDVDLLSAKIGGVLTMSGSTFNGKLNMNTIEVGQHLFMDEEATFKEVDLGSARIGGQLNMNGSIFEGRIGMDTAEVTQSLFALSAKFPRYQELGLQFITIGSNLDLRGATVSAIDLSGATVNGELRLGLGGGHLPPKWVGHSRIVLRNTNIGAVQDTDETDDCWPDQLDLEGFTYQRLGGFGAVGPANMGKRSSAWFASWLMRDTTHSPQPYEQLAKILREMGYPRKADDVLYAGKKLAHRQALNDGEGLRWVGMGLLRWTMGFGLGRRYFRSLLWVLAFTVIGVGVFAVALPAERLDLPTWLASASPAAASKPAADRLDLLELAWASFDRLLPIITLNKAHETLATAQTLPWWALSYFYFQRLVGWVLGSFLVAGFAGLTQRN